MTRYGQTPKNDKRTIIGILFLFIGFAFMMRNFGFIPNFISMHLFSWQTFLIGLGVVMLATKKNNSSGIVLIVIGGFFLVPDILMMPRNYHRMFWPALLMGIGGVIIARHLSGKKEQRDYRVDDFDNFDEFSEFDNQNYADKREIDEVAIFSGVKRKIFTKNFRGGKLTSIFGGVELDLSRADLDLGTNILDIIVIFGGTKLHVPNDWQVYFEVTPIFGGFTDKRRIRPDMRMSTDKVLVIKGICLFGGGDVYSS